MNSLTKKYSLRLIFVVPVLLYIGYELFLTRKFLPLGGVYMSSECTNTNFTAGGNTYQAYATTGVSLPFASQGVGNLMSISIAKDGGGG